MELGVRLQEVVREKKRAAILSIGSAAVLLGLKTFLVVRTESLGVLSEALHSGLDLVAAVITFFRCGSPISLRTRGIRTGTENSRIFRRSWKPDC